jgi:hypothetical protein
VKLFEVELEVIITYLPFNTERNTAFSEAMYDCEALEKELPLVE